MLPLLVFLGEITRDHPRLPEIARDCPRLPEITRDYPRLGVQLLEAVEVERRKKRLTPAQV